MSRLHQKYQAGARNKNGFKLFNINGKATTLLKGELGVSANSGHNTIHTTFKCPVKSFRSAAPIIRNLHTSTYTMPSGVIIAATADPLGGVEPTGGGVWTQATFGGLVAPTIPVKRTGAKSAGYLIGDRIPLASIAPGDGTEYPYVMVRAWVPNSPVQSYTTCSFGKCSIKTSVNFVESWYRYGDHVSVTTGLTNANKLTTGSAYIAGIEFETDEGVIQVLGGGDSIFGGTGSSSNYGQNMYSWFPRAIEDLRAEGLPIGHISYGWGGCNSTDYLDMLINAMDDHEVSVALYPFHTPNDVSVSMNQTIADAELARAITFIAEAKARKIVPVLLAQAPNNNFNSAQDTVYQQLIQDAKNLGEIFFDMTAGCGDGADPERFITGYNLDNNHPNDTGYDGMKPYAKDSLRALILKRPIKVVE